METKVTSRTKPDEISASLSPESLDRLAELVVAGSSPVSRSKGS